MASKLILSKAELIEDVYFKNPSYWTIGIDWTVFLNSAPGAIATASTGTTLTVTNTPLRYATSYKYRLYVKSCSATGTTALIIGSNTINIGASVSPQVYEGVITTATNNKAVVLFSFGGNTIEVNQLSITESPYSFEIDITEQVDIPLNFAIADVKDPSKRNAAYSKNATIPGTKTNNKFFTHIYEISGDGTFNPNKKIKAQVIEDGIELFTGFCQLKNISRIRNGLNNYNNISYEILLVGKLGDFFYLLGDTLLGDLDFSEYDHVYNLTNQRDSWYTQIQKNGSNYINSTNGTNKTISSVSNNLGRAQLNFSAAHGLVAEDWIVIPDLAITAGSEFYYGEHEVYEVVSSTSVIIRCPYDVLGGTTLTTTNTVHKHIKNGEGYVYPMNNYAAVAGNTWSVNKFYPAVYLVEYFAKIAKKVGFVFDGSFLTNTMTKKLIIPYNNGELKLTQAQIDAKKFRASSSASISSSYLMSPSFLNTGTYAYPANYRGHAISGFGVGPAFTPFSNTVPIALDVPINDDSTLPNFDAGATFNTGTYRWTCPNTGLYNLSTNLFIEHNYVLPGGVTQQNTADTLPTGINSNKYNININQPNSYGGSPQMQLLIYDYTTSNAITLGTLTINGFQSLATPFSVVVNGVNLISGHQYGIRLVYSLPARGQFWSAAYTTPYAGNITVNYKVNANAIFYNDISNSALGDGDTILMNMCIPRNKKCKDFFMWVVKEFNLFVQVDKDNEKKLLIETREDFYASGTTIDWTSKLDVDQKLSITPMGELNSKVYEFKHAEDKSSYGKDHVDKYGIGYGNINFTVDNDFIPSDTKNTIETGFASTILSEVQQGAGSGRIISLTTGEELRLLYFNTSSTVNQVPNNTWLHTGLSGSFSRRIFPYAGHLDKVEAPNYDLNWGYPRGVYFDYDSWTNRGLYNQGYKQMIEEITDKNSRLITGNFHLTAKDIFNLDFRNLIIIDVHFLRLNKVNDYLVSKNVPVLCEFIKVERKAPFVPRVYASFTPNADPNYTETERTINGTSNPEIAIDNNTSNSARVGTGVVVNGQENNISNYGSRNISVNGDSNSVGSFCTNITIIGDSNEVYPGLSNVSIINSSSLIITESDVSYLNGELVSDEGVVIDSIDIDSDTQLNASYHNKTLYVDRTASNITLTWDTATMTDVIIKIITTDGTGNLLYINDLDATANYIGNAVPFNIVMNQFDSKILTSKTRTIYNLSNG